MWAMMPMFLQRSNGTVLGTTVALSEAPNYLVILRRRTFATEGSGRAGEMPEGHH